MPRQVWCELLTQYHLRFEWRSGCLLLKSKADNGLMTRLLFSNVLEWCSMFCYLQEFSAAGVCEWLIYHPTGDCFMFGTASKRQMTLILVALMIVALTIAALMKVTLMIVTSMIVLSKIPARVWCQVKAWKSILTAATGWVFQPAGLHLRNKLASCSDFDVFVCPERTALALPI